MVGRKNGWSAYRGKFAALKSNGSVLWKSLLVRDYLYLPEFDKDILTYENCPLEVHCTHAGEPHILIPDLRMSHRDSLQLVKLVSGKEKDRIQESSPALNLVENYNLTVLTESDVRQQPFLNCPSYAARR